MPQRGIGDIVSAAFDVYKANAAKLIAIVAIVVVPLSLIESLLVRVVFAARSTTAVGPFGERVTVVAPRSGFAVLFGSVIGLVLAFVMSFVVQAAVSRAAAQATVGDQVDTDQSYRWGFHRFGSVLLISLLAGLAIFAGLLLLIVPGLIVAVMLAVTIPALVFEDQRGTKALGRSWDLVKGEFWHAAGAIVLTALITGVVTGIFGALGGSGWVLYWIFNAIGRIITVPFAALVVVILYLDLRARTESLTADTLRSELGRSA